jgi:hypothetical protein
MKPMKNIAAAASLAVVFCFPVQSHAQGAQQAPAVSAAPQAKAVPAKRVRSRGNADARHCLQLPTNIEIHKCAHKYL